MSSPAEVITAWGTVGTAAAAVIGLGVSLIINGKDRRRADNQAVADRKTAYELAAADRAAARGDAERRYIIELLLQLGRRIGRQAVYNDDEEGRVAVQQIVLILHALPPECATTVRKRFGLVQTMNVPGRVGDKLGRLRLSSVGAGAEPTQMYEEIADDIDRYRSAAVPAAEVWDQDWRPTGRGRHE